MSYLDRTHITALVKDFNQEAKEEGDELMVLKTVLIAIDNREVETLDNTVNQLTICSEVVRDKHIKTVEALEELFEDASADWELDALRTQP